MTTGNFVGVYEGNLIYVGVADRETFDKIALPMTDHREKGGRHVLSKSVEQRPVMVIFQHWLVHETSNNARKP